MIEINLLPEEMRRTEGTPPARLMAILGSVVAACAIGFFIGKYHLVSIPAMENDIKTVDIEIKGLTEQKTLVEAIRADITNLETKVAALNNLLQSRVRFCRVLDRLCNSVPEGVWFRTFTISPDVMPQSPGGGKRYMISLSGYAAGSTEVDMNRKLTELRTNMRREFNVRPEGPVPANAPADFGWNKFINAKFDAPNLLGKTIVPNLPGPPGDLDEKVRKNIDIMKAGLDFNMTISFEMPAPKTGT